MQYESFDGHLDEVRRRMSELRARAADDPRVLPEALAALEVVLGELLVAQEQLHRQGEQLVDAVRRADAERRRYQELFESAPDAYLVTDAAGLIRENNCAAAVLLAAGQGCLFRPTALSHVAAEDRERLCQQLAALSAQGGRETWRITMERADGARFPAEVTVTALEHARADVSLRWLIRDVSVRYRQEVELQTAYADAVAEREKAEEARLLEVIQEGVPSGIAYLDRDFIHVRVNGEYVRLVHHSREELVGRSVFDLAPFEQVRALFERVRDTGESIEQREVEARVPWEEAPTYWNGHLASVKDAWGNVRGLVLSLVDVTEQVRMREQAVAAERARAELAERFTAEVNHRMKNNLALLSGVLQMQLQTYVGTNPAAEQLRDAITRVAAISVVHEGFYAERPGRVDLHDVLKRTAELAVAALAPENVVVSVTGDHVFIPSRVAGTLAIVANELATNAVKYGGANSRGKRRIAIALACRRGRMDLRVWNSGNPVSNDFPPVSPQGMGIALILGVVEQMGGWFALRPYRGGTLAQLTVTAETLEAEVGYGEGKGER